MIISTECSTANWKTETGQILVFDWRWTINRNKVSQVFEKLKRILTARWRSTLRGWLFKWGKSAQPLEPVCDTMVSPADSWHGGCRFLSNWSPALFYENLLLCKVMSYISLHDECTSTRKNALSGLGFEPMTFQHGSSCQGITNRYTDFHLSDWSLSPNWLPVLRRLRWGHKNH